jgi:DNA-binding transcriptional regulator LsrR (DeoR family)
VPSDPDPSATVAGLAASAASVLERYLALKAPTVMALGIGRTLRAMVQEILPMEQPQHKIVSVVGNLTRDGKASPYDVVMRLADRVGAQCYPLPTPLIADSIEQRQLLNDQHSTQLVRQLASAAKVAFFGIGQIAWEGPLHLDGFITDRELSELLDLGAIGELAGWAFDRHGRLIEGGTNDRVTALPPRSPPPYLTVAVGGGRAKAAALRAAMSGRLISGLITDEAAARAILDELD